MDSEKLLKTKFEALYYEVFKDIVETEAKFSARANDLLAKQQAQQHENVQQSKGIEERLSTQVGLLVTASDRVKESQDAMFAGVHQAVRLQIEKALLQAKADLYESVKCEVERGAAKVVKDAVRELGDATNDFSKKETEIEAKVNYLEEKIDNCVSKISWGFGRHFSATLLAVILGVSLTIITLRLIGFLAAPLTEDQQNALRYGQAIQKNWGALNESQRSFVSGLIKK